MPISSPNSKRCSSRSFAPAAVVALLVVLPFHAHASLPSTPAGQQILKELRSDLARRKGQSLSFAALLGDWEKRYSTNAVQPLIQLAGDARAADPDRYIALMGAAKLGGAPVAPLLSPLLKDRSWMIRSAALRALGALKNPASSGQVLPLLRDPALVVRVEAVAAVETLKPAGSAEALIAALEQSANYHQGKAAWVPQKILSALVKLQAAKFAPRLKPLLLHKKDPQLIAQTVTTLERLTGRRLAQGQPLSARALAWQKAL